ncbi:glycosyltransferase family 2 protein [candidate division KSB1 bacterium]|nr:glycosyltransferase family 2 protein [candidate division KSB1 bacterium]
MYKLSAAIITLNEEKNIEKCLKSITMADEIVIVDGGSTDKTVDICKRYTDKVFVQSFTDFSSQKRSALEKCRNDWVMSIDADEVIRPELASEIKELLGTETLDDGYYIARRSYFLKKWIRYCGWYPGYQMRLFRKSKTTVNTSRVHEGFLVNGIVGRLKNDLDHFSHPTLFSSLQKLNHYTTLEALDRINRKKVHWYHFIFHPLSTFLIKYFSQKGFREGVRGFLLSWIAAYLKMVLYMKIWLLQNNKNAEA